MKNLYFLVVAGCLVFSQVHADTVLPNTYAKSQNEGRHLSAFWGKAQVNHAFVDAFFDSMAVLMINDSEPTGLLKKVATANNTDAAPSASPSPSPSPSPSASASIVVSRSNATRSQP